MIRFNDVNKFRMGSSRGGEKFLSLIHIKNTRTKMVAPTAVVKENVPPTEKDEESDFLSEFLLRLVMINPTETEIPSDAAQTEMHIDEESRPRFPPSTQTITSSKSQIRRITIPPHRLTPLRNQWAKIYPPLVEHLNLQVRMNTKTKQVEMRTSKHTQ